MQPYILVMEDEDALATLLQYNLEKEGYDVTVAADGEEGMLQIDERLPDLVLLDWMLPKLSGIEVCRRIRGKAETRNLPIIMLTARGEESDRVRGLDTGADDYLTKPFSMVELIARIRAVLRRTRALFGTLADDELIDPTISPETLLFRLFHEDGVRLEGARELTAVCRCSRDRIASVLASFDPGERSEMLEPDGKIRVTCEYCATVYALEPDEVVAAQI